MTKAKVVEATPSVGNIQFEYKTYKLSQLPPNDEIMGPEPDQNFLKSIGRFGGPVIPIVVSVWENQLFLIDGGRRIKACRNLKLETINVQEFHENPVTVAHWAPILNEHRSMNPLMEAEFYTDLQKNGEWETIVKEWGLDKNHVKRIMKLTNIHDPLLVEAGKSGKISMPVYESIAALGETRQRQLAEKLKVKGKLTATDVKQVRSVERSGTFSALSGMTMPTAIQEQKNIFVIINQEGDWSIPFFSLKDALDTKGINSKVYRLVEVG